MKITSTNPSRNYAVVGDVEMSTEQEIKDAVAKAHAAQPVWAELSVADRCKAFASFVEVSKGRLGDVAQISAEETGRPITRACEV